MTTKIVHNLKIESVIHNSATDENFSGLIVFPNAEITYDETKITEDQIPTIVYDKIRAVFDERAILDKDDVLVKFLIEDAD